jgi:hypothetical protein
MERSKFEKPEYSSDETEIFADEPGNNGDGPSDDWVHELIAMTRPGVEIEFPVRSIADRPVPFVYDDFD